MKKQIKTFFLCLVLLGLGICSAHAAVDLTFKWNHSLQAQTAFFNSSEQDDDVITIRFEEDKVQVKGKKTQYTVDYKAGEVYGVDQQKKENGSFEAVDWRWKITGEERPEEYAINMNAFAMPLFTEMKKVKRKQSFTFNGFELAKWQAKSQTGMSRAKTLVWTSGGQDDLKEVSRHAKRLMETVGTMPRFPILDTWLRMVSKSGEVPILICREGAPRLPGGMIVGHSEESLIFTELSGRRILTAGDAQALLAIKTWFEKIMDTATRYQDRMGHWAPLIGCAAILLLIFSPAWISVIWDLALNARSSKVGRDEKIHELTIQMYNQLTALKNAGNPSVTNHFKPDASVYDRFMRSAVYQKHFTKTEKISLQNIQQSVIKNTSASGGGVGFENVNDLIKRCDFLLAEH